jgi:hypothetical protein
MELDAPAFVEHGLPDGVTDRVLPPGIGADLAAEQADRIGPLLQGAVGATDPKGLRTNDVGQAWHLKS